MSEIMQILKDIKYPGIDKSIVDFKMIKHAEIEGDKVIVILKNITNMEKFESVKSEIQQKLQSKHPEKKIEVSLEKNAEPQAEPQEQKGLQNIKHVIAVGSGKGGVGKSTVCVNLACETAKRGFKVGLMDADIWGPSIPTMMGSEKTEIFTNENKKIIPISAHGLDIMSIGYFLDPNVPVIWRGPLVSGAVKQFMNDVIWPDLDFLFIDMPPGTGDIQLTLTQSAKIDGVVIVTTPQKIAYIDAIKGVAMFKKMEIPVIGIVENMSYYRCNKEGEKHHIFGQGGGEIVSRTQETDLLGQIPIESEITTLADEGTPLVLKRKDSEAAREYEIITDKILRFFNVK